MCGLVPGEQSNVGSCATAHDMPCGLKPQIRLQLPRCFHSKFGNSHVPLTLLILTCFISLRLAFTMPNPKPSTSTAKASMQEPDAALGYSKVWHKPFIAFLDPLLPDWPTLDQDGKQEFLRMQRDAILMWAEARKLNSFLPPASKIKMVRWGSWHPARPHPDRFPVSEGYCRIPHPEASLLCR